MKEVLKSEEGIWIRSTKFQQELSVCPHLLDGNEMEKRRHRVFNIKLDPSEFNEKLKEVFEKLNLAAKNLALRYLLRNMDTDEFQYFHEVKKM